MKRLTLILLVIAISAILFARCAKEEKLPPALADNIVGEWTRTKVSSGQRQTLIIIFNKDGTYDYSVNIGDTKYYSETGTYTVSGDTLGIISPEARGL